MANDGNFLKEDDVRFSGRTEVKGLLVGRGLNEREGIKPARDRDAWGGMVYRLE